MNFFKGRINRSNYCIGLLIQGLFFLLWTYCVSFVSNALGLKDGDPWQTVLLDVPLIIIWGFGTSLALRRGNDFGGRWAVSLIVALVVGCPLALGGLLGVVLLFGKGDISENKYGRPDTKKFFASVFNLKSS